MSPNGPLISVIIPVKNGERQIIRSLDSAIAQTYQKIEIIVVDDGSTDQTAAVVETAAASDRRIRLFRRPHSGLPATRNFGVSQARGELIAPLDADDLWHPEKIARQVAAMQASPKIGVVYCWVVEIDEDDLIIPPVLDGSTAAGNVLTEMVANAGIITSGGNPLIRRSYYEAVGGYDSSQLLGAEDWKLYLALAQICEFSVVRAHLVGYRRSSGSMSMNVSAMAAAMESVSRWIMDRWKDMPSDVKNKMIYNSNGHLAHLALTNNQFSEALRFKMKGYVARPTGLLEFSSIIFAARFIARTTGLTRSNWPLRSKRIRFSEF